MALTANDRLEALLNERTLWFEAWTNTRDELLRVTDRFVVLVGIAGAGSGAAVAIDPFATAVTATLVASGWIMVLVMGMATLRRATATAGHAVDSIRNINYLRAEIAALPGAPMALERIADRYPASRPRLNWRTAESALVVPMVVTSVIVGALAGIGGGALLRAVSGDEATVLLRGLTLVFGAMVFTISSTLCFTIERQHFTRQLARIEADMTAAPPGTSPPGTSPPGTPVAGS